MNIKHKKRQLKKWKNDRALQSWRRFVLQKYNYTCCCCGSKSELHVHHILSKYYMKHLYVDKNNGILLCKRCHELYHKAEGNGRINETTLIDYMTNRNKYLKLNRMIPDDVPCVLPIKTIIVKEEKPKPKPKTIIRRQCDN